MVGMSSFPIGEDHDARTLLADYACNFQPILPSVFDASVGDVESVTPAYLQNLCCVARLAGSTIGGAASPHFSLREVEDAGAMTPLRHFQHGAAAGLFYVVAMSGDGQDVERRHGQSRFPCSSTTLSRTIRRCLAISFNLGKTRLTCLSVSTKMMITGSLPPASTRWLLST